jgi:transposase
MWAAEGEADIRTVVDTARLGPGTNAFKTILQSLFDYGGRLLRL